MANAIEHFSRHRVEDTIVQVMADMQHGLERLIGEELSVIRHYARLGNWPHKRVNIFVLEDLRPLVSQIKGAAALSSVIANDVDLRPMVNIYDAADFSECSVFVNRSALEQGGLWHDDIALRGLLAHEHAHPLAENKTVRAARALSVEVEVESRIPSSIAPVLHLLADRLCVHAPQEVFANELAVRAGFGHALFHLDRRIVDKARAGVSGRSSLVQSLERQVLERKLSVDQAAAVLLVGDLQGHLAFALETAPFLRAQRRSQADAIEGALIEGVLCHLDPAARRLYEKYRDFYLVLRTDLSAAAMRRWSAKALDILADALREVHLQVRFALVRSRPGRKRQRPPRAERRAVVNGGVEHEEGGRM